MTTQFERVLELPVSASQAMAWHGRPGAFGRLAPPWQRLVVEKRNSGLTDGSERIFRVHEGPVAVRWRARHEPLASSASVGSPIGFADVQVAGPFAAWRHEHLFEDLPGGPNSAGSSLPSGQRSRMIDRITYRLPMGPLGSLVAGSRIESDLDSLFAWRHHTTYEDLALHGKLAVAPMRVAIGGASGLIGRTLVAMLGTGGHRVIRIVRRSAESGDEVGWLGDGFDHPERLDGIDAYIDLGGENVAGGRWTRSRRLEIEESRGPRVTRVIEALGRLASPPRVFACASAIGIYGDTGSDVADESAAVLGASTRISETEEFLQGVARRWEQAAMRAEDFGARVLRLRFGVVLSPGGGALAKMLPPFRAGLGAVPGSGDQRLSWVSVDDAAAAVLHGIADASLAGAVNVVAPEPTTQADLCRTLARVLRRPLMARLPTSAVRLAFGAMGEETLLANTAVVPGALAASGFDHRHGQLEQALRLLLGKASGTEIAIPGEEGAVGRMRSAPGSFEGEAA